MKMYPDDWRIRLTTALTIAVCIIATRMLGPVVGIHGFWPFMGSVIVGIMLGGLMGRLLFPPSSGSPPDHPPRA